jgi:uncharacterized protein YdaU (DUF1376 family)
MARKQPKYVSLEPYAFLSDQDFIAMTAEERGVYCTLIFCLYCNNGKLDYDEKKLRKLCNVNSEFDFQNVFRKFRVRRGKLLHNRVTNELKRSQDRINKAVKAAKKRWKKQCPSNAQASSEQCQVKGSEVKGSNSNSSGITGNVTTSGQEIQKPISTSAKKIISAWQKLPLPQEKKTINNASILAIERQLSVLSADPIEPLHEGMILEAVENYKKALKLPNSQTYKHTLYNWLFKGHVRKYVSYAFDIDHHDGSKFTKDENEGKTRLFPISGRMCGKRGCGMPAVYKEAGEFDHYYCGEHLPAKVKEKYYA